MSKNNESNFFIKNSDNKSKQSQNLEEQKSKELLRIKKSISMKNDLYEFKNININQSLESNRNLKKESIYINNNNISKKKIVKMRSCITGIKNMKNQKYNNLNKENSSSNNTMSIQEEIILKNKWKNINNEKEEIKEIKEIKEKKLKNEIKEIKEENEEKIIEFYINDNKKNIIYKLEDNTLTTSKYNKFTFIPKGLLYQFTRWPKIYFLFIAIVQTNSLISPFIIKNCYYSVNIFIRSQFDKRSIRRFRKKD